jgi:hypothetical protein
MLNLFQHLTGRAACLVYIVQTFLPDVYLAYRMPKQVLHNVFLSSPYQ